MIAALQEGLASIMDSVSDRVMERYREALFGDATMQDLPADTDVARRFVFYATSLQNGASVRLSRPCLADYRIGMLPQPRLEPA
jgi:NTE family protein